MKSYEISVNARNIHMKSFLKFIYFEKFQIIYFIPAKISFT